jgi:hypothetical protein
MAYLVGNPGGFRDVANGQLPPLAPDEVRGAGKNLPIVLIVRIEQRQNPHQATVFTNSYYGLTRTRFAKSTGCGI